MSLDLIGEKLSTFIYTTRHFVNPSNHSLKWKPYDNQSAIYNLIDNGYDIMHKEIRPIKLPRIVVIVGPRQRYGKSEGIASAAAATAIRKPDSYILIASSDETSAKNMLYRVRSFLINANNYNKSDIDDDKAYMLRLSNGTIIEAGWQSENFRGRPASICFIDEAAIITENILKDVYMPSTSMAGYYLKYGTPDIILSSTPKGMKGTFYEFYHKGLESRQVGCRICKTIYNRSDFPNIKIWLLRELPPMPACDKCGSTNWEYVDNEIAVYHVDPYKHPTITREYVERLISIDGNTPHSRQEYLGDFIAEASSVFNESWITQCSDGSYNFIKDPVPGTAYVMSADIGKTHDAMVFMLGHLHSENKKKILDHMYYKPTKGGGQEYEEIRYDLLLYIDKFRPYYIFIDSTGIGDAVVERLENDLKDLQLHGCSGSYKRNGRDIEWEIHRNKLVKTFIYHNKKTMNRNTGKPQHLGFVFDVNTKFELIQNGINNLARQLCILPRPNLNNTSLQVLIDELINFGYEISDNSRTIYGTQNGNDDSVIAYTLLLWGLDNMPSFSYTRPRLSGEDQYVIL